MKAAAKSATAGAVRPAAQAEMAVKLSRFIAPGFMIVGIPLFVAAVSGILLGVFAVTGGSTVGTCVVTAVGDVPVLAGRGTGETTSNSFFPSVKVTS